MQSQIRKSQNVMVPSGSQIHLIVDRNLILPLKGGLISTFCIKKIQLIDDLKKNKLQKCTKIKMERKKLFLFAP